MSWERKRYVIETFSIDRVLNKGYFHGKTMQKCAPKASPRPLFTSSKYLKTAITCKKLF